MRIFRRKACIRITMVSKADIEIATTPHKHVFFLRANAVITSVLIKQFFVHHVFVKKYNTNTQNFVLKVLMLFKCHAKSYFLYT